MTALGKNHRRRGVGVSPVAPDIAVGDMDVTDGLIKLNADEPAYLPFIEKSTYGVKEGGVTKNVGNDKALGEGLGHCFNLVALLKARYHWFLTQDVKVGRHRHGDSLCM